MPPTSAEHQVWRRLPCNIHPARPEHEAAPGLSPPASRKPVPIQYAMQYGGTCPFTLGIQPTYYLTAPHHLHHLARPFFPCHLFHLDLTANRIEYTCFPDTRKHTL